MTSSPSPSLAGRFARSLAVSFLVFLVLDAALNKTPVGSDVNHGVNLSFAATTAWLADICGMPSLAVGTSVIGPRAAIAVVDECNALSAWTFMIVILAMIPMSLRHRIYRVTQITAFCALINQARLSLLHWVINFHPDWWPQVHGPPMQALCILLILAWMLFVVLKDTSAASSPNLTSHA